MLSAEGHIGEYRGVTTERLVLLMTSKLTLACLGGEANSVPSQILESNLIISYIFMFSFFFRIAA